MGRTGQVPTSTKFPGRGLKSAGNAAVFAPVWLYRAYQEVAGKLAQPTMHPVLFKIGTFELRSFAVAMIAAFFLSVWLAQSRGPRFGMTKAQVGDLAFWSIVAGVLGARIVFIAQEWGYYSKHLHELFSWQFAGLTSFGGLIFGMVAAILWSRKKGIPVRNMLDAVAPAFLVGHLIGRIGCLFNGCCFGGACPADLPWAVHVEGSPILHHPAQIYDSLMNLAALGIVLFAERRWVLRAGAVTGLVVALHGVSRFIYEFWRAGTQAQVDRGEASSTYWFTSPFPITQAQAMALALVLLGIGIAAFGKRRAEASVPEDVVANPA